MFIFYVNVGEEGKLFGLVMNQDIEEQLREVGLDFEVDRRWIILEDSIKALGDFQVPVKLHPEVIAELSVKVVAAE